MFRALPVRVLHRDVEAHAVKLLEDGAPVIAVGALEVTLATALVEAYLCMQSRWKNRPQQGARNRL